MNCICLISIGRDNLLQYSLPTVEYYCKKYGINLEVITSPKYNISSQYNNYNYLIFEKFQVYDLFERHKGILRLDTNIIIQKNCPNLFENKDAFTVYATREDIGKRKLNRFSQINQICSVFGKGWFYPYFNSDVVLSYYDTREIYNLTKEDIKNIKTENLGYFKEQNLLNWKVNHTPCVYENLGYQYNFLKVYDDEGYPRKKAYIIHYAGKQLVKENNMERDFELWKRSCDKFVNK